MGYRSRVVAVFYSTVQEQNAALKLWLRENFPLDTWGNCIEWHERGLVFKVDVYKWYENDPDVQVFDAFVNKYIELFTSSTDVPYAYEFVRLGEEYEDIEVIREGDYDYLIDVERSVRVDI